MKWLKGHEHVTQIIYVPAAAVGFLLVEIAGLPFIVVALVVCILVGLALAVLS